MLSLIQDSKPFWKKQTAVSVHEEKFQINNEVALKLFENTTCKNRVLIRLNETGRVH